MTKFSRREDAGFRQVSNQLWLWLSQVKTERTMPTSREQEPEIGNIFADNGSPSTSRLPNQRQLEYDMVTRPFTY